jgi:lysozyme
MKPLPTGAHPLPQADVTPAIGAWAVELLHDTALAMGDVAGPVVLDGRLLVARVEEHSWYGADKSKPAAPHRGVTVYELLGGSVAAASDAVRVAGVDVSTYQPAIDWSKVAEAGQRFAIVKATEGFTWTSPRFVEQVTGAKAAGLLVGAYHFFRSTSAAVDQMKHFLDTVGALGFPLDLPLALDVEEAIHDHEAAMSMAASVRVALDELVRLTGRRPLLYISPSYAAALPDQGFADVADLWIAHYDVRAPKLPPGFKEWKLWQFSGSATIPGIGKGDANVFAGDLEALRSWAGLDAGDADTLRRLTTLADDVDAGKEGLGPPDTDPAPKPAA